MNTLFQSCRFSVIKMTMELQIITAITVLTRVSGYHYISPASSGFLEPSSNIQRRCGETMTKLQGHITYKPYESLQPNERCVWTVRYPRATSFIVNVNSIGLPGSLIITGLGRQHSRQYTVPDKSGSWIIPNSNVLVLTFYTGASVNGSNARGFNLDYVARTYDSSQGASDDSADVLLGGELGQVRHPRIMGERYNNKELSIFIYAPRNGVWQEDVSVDVIFGEIGLEKCCDFIVVYNFDQFASTGYKWRQLGEMRGGSEAKFIRSNDLLMFVFQSDIAVQDHGFYLTYFQSKC